MIRQCHWKLHNGYENYGQDYFICHSFHFISFHFLHPFFELSFLFFFLSFFALEQCKLFNSLALGHKVHKLHKAKDILLHRRRWLQNPELWHAKLLTWKAHHLLPKTIENSDFSLDQLKSQFRLVFQVCLFKTLDGVIKKRAANSATGTHINFNIHTHKLTTKIKSSIASWLNDFKRVKSMPK